MNIVIRRFSRGIVATSFSFSLLLIAGTASATVGWQQLPNLPGAAHPAVSVAAESTMGVQGPYAVGFDGNVYLYSRNTKIWSLFASPNPKAKLITANTANGRNGSQPWIVDITGQVQYYQTSNGNFFGGQFVPLNANFSPPGGNTVDIAADSGDRAFFIAQNAVWEGDNATVGWGVPCLTPTGMTLESVTVDSTDLPWVVDSNGLQWQCLPPAPGQLFGVYQQVPGNGVLRRFGPHVMGLGDQNQNTSVTSLIGLSASISGNSTVYAHTDGTWILENGNAVQLSMDPTFPDDVVTVASDGTMYLLTGALPNY